MPRVAKKLSFLEVDSIRQPGLWAVGDNLSLNITENGMRSWIFRYMLNGRAREMGLGSCRFVSLQKARETAKKCGEQVAHDIDPIETRKTERAERQRLANRITFKEGAERFITKHESAWKTPRQGRLWRNTLELHAYPKIGAMLVQDIQTTHILKVVEPIWFEITATAKTVLNRIEQVFDDLITRSDYKGSNPARWVHHLEHSLPTPSKVRAVKHFPSLPFERLPEFMMALQEIDHLGTRPLEFSILTLMRTDTVLVAPWKEIPEGSLNWNVAPENLKGRRENDEGLRVPLCNRALEIVEERRKCRSGPLIFPGTKNGKPLANNTMLITLGKMGAPWDDIDMTTHGFRSSFRTWAAECTNYQAELIEVCMAHTVLAARAAGVSVEVWKAYQRGEMLEKRRALMNDWGKYALGQ